MLHVRKENFCQEYMRCGNEPAKLLDRFKAIIPELEAAIAKK